MNHIATRDRIADAVDRDLADAKRLERIQRLVTKLLDQMAKDAADLSHPDCRWQPDDLIEVLVDQAKSIRWELNRVTRGAVVLGDY